MTIAKTVKEAQAQVFALPRQFDDKEWRRFARQIGYCIAQELGFDLMTWAVMQEDRHQNCGTWNLDILEIRLMLFYEFRADYMGAYTYHERDHLVDSLLTALHEKMGQAYERLKA